MDTQNNPPIPTKPKVKIIDSIPAFLIAVATLGPFALPLLWRNPRFSRKVKVGWSIAVLLFTLWLIKFGKDMIGDLVEDKAQQIKTTTE